MFNALLLWQAAAPELGSPWGTYVKLLLLLAGLLCFFYVGAQFLARRFGSMRGGRGGNLELVDRLGLEPRRTIYTIRAGPRFLVVASSESGLQLLTEMSPAELPGNSSDPENQGGVS